MLQVAGNASIAQSASVGGELNVGGALNIAGGKLTANVADGASAVGFTFNNTVTLATSGAKLISFQNNGTEKFYIDKDGNVGVVSGAAVGFQGSGNVENVVTKKFTCTAATTTGDLVIIDTGTAGRVTTTATANSPLVAGVVRTGVGAAATCEVAIEGIIQINVDTTAVAIGDLLVSSTTTGKATPNNTPGVGQVIGKALSSKTGGANGTVWVLLSSFK
jgi:hypothetical protein